MSMHVLTSFRPRHATFVFNHYIAFGSSMNDPLSSARSLRPLVEAEADATDRELTMTRSLVEAFAETGLNHLQVPKALGGLEADVDTALDVIEELAHQDGSVGWSFMANA